MKNKKRIYQGYNRKQIKKVAVWLQKQVNSITNQLEEVKKTNRVLYTQLEEEKARHKEYKDLCVAYTSKNLDIRLAHDQDVLRYKRVIKTLEDELVVTENRNSKLVEQLEHFTSELQYVNDENTKLALENAKLKQRGLLKRIFNRG